MSSSCLWCSFSEASHLSNVLWSILCSSVLLLSWSDNFANSQWYCWISNKTWQKLHRISFSLLLMSTTSSMKPKMQACFPWRYSTSDYNSFTWFSIVAMAFLDCAIISSVLSSKFLSYFNFSVANSKEWAKGVSSWWACSWVLTSIMCWRRIPIVFSCCLTRPSSDTT